MTQVTWPPFAFLVFIIKTREAPKNTLLKVKLGGAWVVQ